MNDEQRVYPHVLYKGVKVAVVAIDDVATLVVPVSEESAHSFVNAAGLEGMQARPVTVEEIEAECAYYGLGCVGLYGLDDDMSMDVLSIEALALALE
jgi:hypothetical protein